MRSTRSNTIPDNCFIFGIPIEVLQQMMQHLPPGSLASLSETCRRFRDLFDPVLLKEVNIQAKKIASFDPLRKLCKNGGRKSLVRSVTVQDRVYSFDRMVAFSKILVGILPKVSDLTSVDFPFSFLSTGTFQAIYRHPSIERLSLNSDVEHRNLNTLGLDEDPLPPLPKRSVPLTVPLLQAKLFSDEAHNSYHLLGSLLAFLDFYDVGVTEIDVQNNLEYIGFRRDEGHLASTFASGLTSLHIRLPQNPGPTSFDWISNVFSVQTSLEHLHLSVGAWGTFLLDSTTWRMWSNGTSSSTSSLDFSPWALSPISTYKATISRSLGILDLHLLSWGFFAVQPALLASLQSLAPNLATLRLGAGWNADLLWPDLDGTIDAFATLSSLTTLHLKSSLTPTYRRLKDVVACSQACYDTLETTHLTLHAAAELVGGRQALQSLDLEINLARFRKIVAGVGIPSTENRGSGQTLVRWEVQNGRGCVLGYEANVSLEGGVRVVSMRETSEGGSLPSSKALLCIVCDPWNQGQVKDPVRSIMACEVGEVRAALKAGGLDLDEFDSRDPPPAAEISAFESFLRSA